LPPAVLRARARVSGRVNDVAFSPSRPLIAVGTGVRKLVLWDFQRGDRAETHGGFAHSIGRVAFTADDALLCAERVRPGEKCTLHGWRGGERFAVVQGDAVTALEPAGGSQLIVARRDGRVALLDVATGGLLKEESFAFWCRAVRVAADGARAALLHDRITLVGLPGLGVLAEGRRGGGVLNCAAFVEGGLVAGRFNGEVLLYRGRGENLTPERRALPGHKKGVQGIEWLGRYSALLTAGAEGALIFTAWPGGSVLGRVRVEGERLTSVHVSPGGDFMAVGDSDASMSLWDLRVLEVPALLARPFAAALPAHLAAVNALLDAGAQPAGVGPALRFMQCVLQHRFRYDVEVDEVPGIRAGEFDIEVA
jgi:WD40 repeat protein